MDKKDKIFKHIKIDGKGLEIGPSHNPLAPRKEGYDVQIIDHASKEQLIEKYKDHNVNLNNIEEVDYIWSGENFEELTGKSNYYDYIIASHLIEHIPDLIRFLQDCATVLNDNGLISLVIPDKRYCFDHFRPISGLSKIIDSYYLNRTIHSPGSVAEYYLNVVSNNGKIAWDINETEENYTFVHSLINAKEGIDSVVEKKIYLDVHAWCFTPSSFRLIIHDLFSLNLISLKETCFFDTEGCEFYVTLGKNGKGLSESRLRMLERIELELAQPVIRKIIV